jgi:hypothetical protein
MIKIVTTSMIGKTLGLAAVAPAVKTKSQQMEARAGKSASP